MRFGQKNASNPFEKFWKNRNFYYVMQFVSQGSILVRHGSILGMKSKVFVSRESQRGRYKKARIDPYLGNIDP